MTHARRADDDTLSRALGELPIFPLPGTVFFPHTLLPLHVFEPRYRQLTQAVLDSHQHMAVVLIEHQHPGAVSSCARVGGLGRVVHHEKLPDGRFHILLQGVARVELVEELPMGELLYRRVRARAIDGHGTDGADRSDGERARIDQELRTLRSCYARLLEAMPACKDTLGDLPLRLDEPSVVCDVVCAAALEDIAARQAALEEPDVCARLEKACQALATLLLKSLPEKARMH